MKKYILLSILIFTGIQAHLQISENAKAQFSNNGEVYFKTETGSQKLNGEL